LHDFTLRVVSSLTWIIRLRWKWLAESNAPGYFSAKAITTLTVL